MPSRKTPRPLRGRTLSSRPGRSVDSRVAPLLQRLLRREAATDGAVTPAPPRRRRPAPPASELRRERRALLRLREQKLRDLGGLSLEMYRRDRFREDLLLERCAELIGLEARIHELDVLLGAVRPLAGGAAHRPLRCGAPLLWGSRFCANCGRPVAGGEEDGRRTHDDGDPAHAALPALRRRRSAGPGVLPRVRRPARARARRPGRAGVRGVGGAAPLGRRLGLPALLGLVIAVLGTGAAIAISGDGEEPSAVSTATGGSLTVTDSDSTLTAPEPTTSHDDRRSADNGAGDDHADTAGEPGRRHAGRADRRGWTIVLLSLPQANGRPRPRREGDGGTRAADCGGSASSTRPATRASTPATTSSSRASSTPRPRRRARCSARGRSSRRLPA